MKSYAQLIITTSLKTIAFIISAIFMLALLCFSLFPRTAVEFYSAIGYTNRVYYYQSVLAKTDATWAYKSAQSSIELNRNDEEKAEAISRFLSYNDENAIKRINDYNLAFSPSRAYDVLLYSVENYMAVEYAKITGQIWNGSKFVSKDEVETEILRTSSAHDYAMMVNVLCEIEEFGFVEDVLSKSEDFQVQGLEELFLLRAVVSFSEKTNVEYEVWGMPVAEYYEDCMTNYCA